MLSLGLGLTLLSGLGWVVSDALRKRLADNTDPMLLAVWLAGGQLLVVLAIWPILSQLSFVGEWSQWRVDSAYWWVAVPTFVTTSAGHLFFLKSLRASDLGLTIPYLSFSPIFVLVFAMVFLGERPTVMALLGLCIVAVGAFFLNRPQLHGDAGPEVRAAARKGAVLMLFTAVCWSAAAAFDKAALSHASPLAHLILLLVSTVVILEVVRRMADDGSPDDDRVKTAVVPLGLVCAAMTLALALQLSAYTYWDVAYVEAVKRAMGLVGSVVVGAVVFGERELRKRLMAVVVMAIGAALVVLGG